MLPSLRRYVKNFKYPHIEKLYILEQMNFLNDKLMNVEKYFYESYTTIL